MIRSRLRIAIIAATAAISSVGTTTSLSPPAAHARAEGALAITGQSFNVTVDGRFELELAMPDTIDPVAFDQRARIVITSHRSIPDRAEFHAALDGALPPIQDTFTISLDPALADPNVVSIVDRTITVSVPTEAASQTNDALQVLDTGVHPLTIDLRVGGRRAGLTTTFVNRLAIDGASFGALSIGLIIGQKAPPELALDGTVVVSATARAELRRLAETLTAIADAPAVAGLADTQTPARGVRVEPAVLQVLGEDDPELAARLAPLLSGSDLFAATRLPLDPSSAAAAGQEALYTDWLRDGENLLDAAFPGTSVDRSVYLVDSDISNAAAAMQRNLGTRMMVMPFDIYTELDGSLREFTDISQLVTIELADASTMPAAIIDSLLAEQMATGGNDPLATAIEIVAELAVLAGDINDDGGIVDNHGLVLALPDAGIPDARLMAELTPLLVSTPGLRLVEPRDLSTNVDTLLNDGRLVTVTLPETAGPDLSGRLRLVDDISADLLTHASMLAPGAPDVDRWSTMLATFTSTALDDDQVDAMVAVLEDDFTRYRTGIRGPEPFAFTLTGSDSKFRFSIRNVTDTELSVRVQLSSPKIQFPDSDQIVVIAPQSSVDVVTRAHALSNGKSSVFLRILAPAQSSDLELVPEVVLTARVNSLAGLGQLITGAGLLLIVTWWVHHARKTRRAQLSTQHQGRHPAAAGSVTPS